MAAAIDHHLLEGIYGTAEQEGRWVDVLDRMRLQLNARSAVVQMLTTNESGLRHIWTGRDTRSLAEAELHDRFLNNPDNPRLDQSLWRGSFAEIGSDRRLFEGNGSGLARLRKELLQTGLGQAFWAGFALSDHRHFTLILHREPGDERDLEEEEEACLRALLPHLKQTLRLSSRLADSAARVDALQGALNGIRSGLLICDQDLKVHWCNHSAEDMIGRSSQLDLAGGRLRAIGGAAPALHRLVASPHLKLSAAFGRPGEAPLHVRAAEASPASFGAAEWIPGAVALFLSEPNAVLDLDPAEMAALYGLTPAEARLAAALVRGSSLNDYAEARGIAVGTARIQLKQILSKTSTHRQADLVRLLCNGIGAHAAH